VSFLLPQSRAGTVLRVRPVDLHGDRYVDLVVKLDDVPGAPATGRLAALECPAGLTEGERVVVRFTMGVMVGIARAT